MVTDGKAFYHSTPLLAQYCFIGAMSIVLFAPVGLHVLRTWLYFTMSGLGLELVR